MADPMDLDSPAPESTLLEDARPAYFKIALDFGTTRTAVACMKYEHEQLPPGRRLDPEGDIFMIANYPDAPEGECVIRQDVPTELWIPKKRPPYATRSITRRGSTPDSIHTPPGSETDEDTDHDFESIAAIAAAESGMLQEIRWGYGVHEKTTDPSISGKDGRTVSKFKLTLDTSGDEETKKVQLEVQSVVDELQRRGQISHSNDLFSIYLHKLFQHVHKELIDKHGFNSKCRVEPILCVPAIWQPKACRVMVRAVGKAMKQVGLFAAHPDIDPDFFIVSEAEAASTLVLEKRRGRLRPEETFVLLDAGGGTVDAACYSISAVEPLRLRQEAVPEKGSLCGSSYLNAAFKDLLTRKLEPKHLWPGSPSINRVIDAAVEQFEYNTKRMIDIREDKLSPVNVPSVRCNSSKRSINNGKVWLTKSDKLDIFMPRLDGVVKLMEEQLEGARNKGLIVSRVILTGGFSASPSLKHYVEECLEKYKIRHQRTITLDFLTNIFPSTAVARGAIIRAARKEEGPERIVRSSYGFLQKEQYDPANVDAHKEASPYRDKIDGHRYVNTIMWFIQKGDRIDNHYQKPITMIHTFHPDESKLICKELLYVADERLEPHYARRHERNTGAEVQCYVVADMTFLKTQNLISIKEETGEGLEEPRRYYEIELDLVVRVEGRSLVAEAFWPTLQKDAGAKVYGSIRHSIAAAFQYGTK